MKKTWIIALILFASCSNTHITSSWKNDQVPPAYYNKIMVIALIPDNQRNIRQAMEKSMVEQLRHNGYNAISGFQQYGPKAFEGLDENATLAKVKADSADALITIALTNHTRSRSYVPGAIYPSPWGWGWGGGYYGPGYIRNNNKYAWEANFYEAGTARMAYSVQSQSFDPSSAHDLAEAYSRQIVRDMKDKGVLVRHVKE
jgi:hypothetical protein